MLERYGCEEISSSRDGYCVWSGDDNDSQKISITAKYGCTAVTCRKRYSDNQKAVHLIGYTRHFGRRRRRDGNLRTGEDV